MPKKVKFDYPDPILAGNIKKLIEDNHLTYTEFAKCCNKERKTTLNWVNEYTSPSAWDLKQICLTYKVSADELLGLKGE